MDDFIAAFTVLQTTKDETERRNADTWLRNWQVSPEAWDATAAVLQSSNQSEEVLLFVAITLRRKIMFNYFEIPEGSPTTIWSFLLLQLERFPPHSPIFETLILAMSDLCMVTALYWKPPLSEFIKGFTKDSNYKPILALLLSMASPNEQREAIAELSTSVVYSRYLKAEQSEITKFLANVVQNVEDPNVKAQALCCAIAWFTIDCNNLEQDLIVWIIQGAFMFLKDPTLFAALQSSNTSYESSIPYMIRRMEETLKSSLQPCKVLLLELAVTTLPPLLEEAFRSEDVQSLGFLSLVLYGVGNCFFFVHGIDKCIYSDSLKDPKIFALIEIFAKVIEMLHQPLFLDLMRVLEISNDCFSGSCGNMLLESIIFWEASEFLIYSKKASSADGFNSSPKNYEKIEKIREMQLSGGGGGEDEEEIILQLKVLKMLEEMHSSMGDLCFKLIFSGQYEAEDVHSEEMESFLLSSTTLLAGVKLEKKVLEFALQVQRHLGSLIANEMKPTIDVIYRHVLTMAVLVEKLGYSHRKNSIQKTPEFVGTMEEFMRLLNDTMTSSLDNGLSLEANLTRYSALVIYDSLIACKAVRIEGENSGSALIFQHVVCSLKVYQSDGLNALIGDRNMTDEMDYKEEMSEDSLVRSVHNVFGVLPHVLKNWCYKCAHPPYAYQYIQLALTAFSLTPSLCGESTRMARIWALEIIFELAKFLEAPAFLQLFLMVCDPIVGAIAATEDKLVLQSLTLYLCILFRTIASYVGSFEELTGFPGYSLNADDAGLHTHTQTIPSYIVKILWPTLHRILVLHPLDTKLVENCTRIVKHSKTCMCGNYSILLPLLNEYMKNLNAENIQSSHLYMIEWMHDIKKTYNSYVDVLSEECLQLIYQVTSIAMMKLDSMFITHEIEMDPAFNEDFYFMCAKLVSNSAKVCRNIQFLELVIKYSLLVLESDDEAAINAVCRFWCAIFGRCRHILEKERDSDEWRAYLEKLQQVLPSLVGSIVKVQSLGPRKSISNTICDVIAVVADIYEEVVLNHISALMPSLNIALRPVSALEDYQNTSEYDGHGSACLKIAKEIGKRSRRLALQKNGNLA